MQYSRRDASKGKVSSHSLLAGQQNVPPSAGGLPARLEEGAKTQLGSSDRPMKNWRPLTVSCGRPADFLESEWSISPAGVRSTWFESFAGLRREVHRMVLDESIFRGIFLRFISFLFAELISEMYVALNTKDGHSIRVIFHDQLPTSVLITSTITSTCDAGISQRMHQIVIKNDSIVCLSDLQELKAKFKTSLHIQ